MNRQAQAMTIALVVLVLGVVAALMATASPQPDEQAAPTAATPSPSPEDSPEDSGPSGPSSPAAAAQPLVRLPEPSDEASGRKDQQAPGRGAAQRRKREAKERRELVPALPDIAPGSLECIEAIAQRRTLTVATFNIHGGFGGGGLNLDDIGREIARMGPDVALLQEVDRGRRRSRRQDQASILASRLGMNVAYDPNSGRRSGGTIGNAVLSRFPITSVRRATLPRGGAEPRGVMRVTVDIENVEVAVFVTHLEHTSGGVRRRQMRYIAGAVRREGLPHVLGGDLNATPGSAVLGIARRVLRDAWPAAGRGGARTVPRARIDYLMHGPTVRALEARVVPSRISDHHAVIGAFEVGPPEACGQG